MLELNISVQTAHFREQLRQQFNFSSTASIYKLTLYMSRT